MDMATWALVSPAISVGRVQSDRLTIFPVQFLNLKMRHNWPSTSSKSSSFTKCNWDVFPLISFY